MEQKVCLDTDVCISIIKGENKSKQVGDLIGSGKLFVSAVTVFELHLRKENIDDVTQLLDGIVILNFNNACAIRASEISKELQSDGFTVDFRDIFIASTALYNGCTLATFNKKHFSKIKELKLLNI